MTAPDPDPQPATTGEPSEHPETPEKASRILEAARSCFSQYGFRRTTMDDIARAADVSRPALYQHFRNKEAIFAQLSRRLFHEAIARAETAFAPDPDRPDRDIEARLLDGFEAWSVQFVAMLHQMPHAHELIDASCRLAGEVVAESEERIEALVHDVLNQAVRQRQIDLKALGLNARSAAHWLYLTVKGLKQPGLDVEDYRQHLKTLIQIFVTSVKRS